jgi:hypothetical protein
MPPKLRLTQKHCEKWVTEPLVNPKTGYAIKADGPTFKLIAEACAKYNLSAVTPMATTGRTLLRKIGTFKMPQTRDEWQERQNMFQNIFIMYDTFQVASNSLLQHSKIYTEMCELAIEFELPHENDIPRISEWATRFRHINDAIAAGHKSATQIDAITTVPDFYMYENLFQKQAIYILDGVKKLTGTLLIPDIATENMDTLYRSIKKASILIREYNYQHMHILLNADSRNISNQNQNARFVCLTESQIDTIKNSPPNTAFNEFLVELKEIEAMQSAIDAAKAEHSVNPTTRSRSLPNSISIERITSRIPIPKRPVPVQLEDGTTVLRINRDAPDEYRDIEYFNEPVTDRNSFRRHSKMSFMTPFSSSEHLDSLPEKTRVTLLNELRAACNYMKDGVTHKRFDRMHKKGLHLIVQLGNNQGQKHCYYVRNLYKIWQNNVKENKDFQNPITRALVTPAEKADILNKMKYVDRKAPNPENITNSLPIRDPKLMLQIDEIIGLDESIYYNIRLMRKFGNMVYIIQKLGVVPADIDSVDGDINISSSSLISSIRELFANGKLMINSLVPPYNCCRVHLDKTFEYWGTGNRRNNRLRLMIDEISRVA